MECLERRFKSLGDRKGIREVLEGRGWLIRPEGEGSFSSPAVGAVDGSYVVLGSPPFGLGFFRAVALGGPALHAAGSAGGNQWEVVRERVLWPGEEIPAEGGEPELHEFARPAMAALELEVAGEALGRMARGGEERPLLLLDGGFARFRRQVPGAWESFSTLARREEVMVLGVVEDMASSWLGELHPPWRGYWDREVLFGVLERGEAVLLHPGGEGFGRGFVALSSDPLPVGLNFWEEQREEVACALALLLPLTPPGSRGVPLPLDLADRRARVSRAEAERWLESLLPAAHRERIFRPKRERRWW
jgi:hypothetical protein